ncbi:MAG: pyridoxamine 5'-phosphate oxidase family protein [Candidatus Cloacimonetes bacterium]|nr:pyridoxamine 5'-phosphate oxidase family protein [Candidatus Cloacimonadota bacterium]
MRKADREIKDFNELEEILAKSQVCYLSLIDADYPYTLPLNYGYRDKKLYFHCATEGKKLDLLRINPNCSFAVSIDHELITDGIASHCTMKYRSVCGKGIISELQSDEEKAFALQVLMEQYVPDKVWDFKGGCFDRVGILCLDIEKMTGKKR